MSNQESCCEHEYESSCSCCLNECGHSYLCSNCETNTSHKIDKGSYEDLDTKKELSWKFFNRIITITYGVNRTISWVEVECENCGEIRLEDGSPIYLFDYPLNENYLFDYPLNEKEK